MKRLATIIVLLFMACAYAQASKPCDELKSEIAKKLDDKGVKGYTLDIVDKDKTGDAKDVGSCEGGTKKIVYSREAMAEKAEKPAAKKTKEPAK